MLTETTFKLPDNLVARAQQYAHEHHTTLTAIIRKHLDTVTAAKNDPLIEFSQADITKEEAISALGLRDYSQLLVALGDADLPLPVLPEKEIAEQVAMFTRIWRES